MSEVINIPEYPDCEMSSETISEISSDEAKTCAAPMHDNYNFKQKPQTLRKQQKQKPQTLQKPQTPETVQTPQKPQKQETLQKPQKQETLQKPQKHSWTEDITETVEKWRDDISKNSFIYGQLLDNKETYIQCVLIFTLILSILMTILSGISIALSSLNVGINFQWIIFTFNIIILISSGLITGLNGVIKIFSWDDQIKIFTKIIEKLDTQWFVFETELNIPAIQRQNAEDFIKRVNTDYMHLMQICPHIGLNDYVKANKNYQESLSNNLIWQHNFRKEVEAKLNN